MRSLFPTTVAQRLARYRQVAGSITMQYKLAFILVVLIVISGCSGVHTANTTPTLTSVQASAQASPDTSPGPSQPDASSAASGSAASGPTALTATSSSTSTAVTTYSLTSQPPSTWNPYSANIYGLFTKQLPNAGKGGPINHLYPNSDTIARCALTDCGGITKTSGSSPSTSIIGFMQWATPGKNDMGHPLYYSKTSDPWYSLTCHQTTNTFHAPRNAQYSKGGGDDYLTVWDQSTNLMVELYRYCSSSTGCGYTLGSCSATSSASACPITVSSCAVENVALDQDWGLKYKTTANNTGGSVATGNGASAWAGILRQEEVMNGVHHALRLFHHCANASDPYVFPSQYGDTGTTCSDSPDRPPAGALLFLDYTDAQIAAMNLPTWQKNIITALAHYGGYLGVTTHGTAGLSIGSNNLEDSQAWSYAGLTDPFWSWLRSQPGVGYVYGTTGSDRYQVNIFGNIPLVGGTTILHHIHMADPCVAKSLARQPGGCL